MRDLEIRGEIVHEWDSSVKSSVLAYNTTVHSRTGVTPFYGLLGIETILSVDWVYPTPNERQKHCGESIKKHIKV